MVEKGPSPILNFTHLQVPERQNGGYNTIKYLIPSIAIQHDMKIGFRIRQDRTGHAKLDWDG